MKLSLELAKKGLGDVEPNPAVGCVIVKNNKIIGKGYHKQFGKAHAEINALKNCTKSPAGATMYVTLEPCCHKGKTGPCTDAIIKADIKKLVAATKDPTKKVGGKGFAKLRKAGIKVVTGVCGQEAQSLNPAFFKFARTKRPWVVVKWAQSRDGFLGRMDKKKWISGSKSRKDSHKLRKSSQAVLVGINTVRQDNPLLTVRPDRGHQPLRVVLDSQLQTPADSKLVKTAKKVPVCIFTATNKKLKGVKTVKVGKSKGKLNLKAVLLELGRKNVQQVLVEGGEKVITSFLKQKLADEIVVYTSAEKLGKNGIVKTSAIMKKAYNQLRKKHIDKKKFDKDVRLRGIVG
ncbi:MAG: bifunctional diaminohydroxyphosphoribosylaminopyrimidine deaminase/5-amino-6-(5-phosphoribosylamino)uracil reductase RibD [Sedimentisphaerales bacterium]|nr:bifunctional diaminohydroxyphosphoribosylaminopyrimidine deaminase/5-amino-6-(5-phosphoribosylamino)uracil reductase RibD [Sedimentisphaerales bacterium]